MRSNHNDVASINTDETVAAASTAAVATAGLQRIVNTASTLATTLVSGLLHIKSD